MKEHLAEFEFGEVAEFFTCSEQGSVLAPSLMAGSTTGRSFYPSFTGLSSTPCADPTIRKQNKEFESRMARADSTQQEELFNRVNL